MKHIDPQTRMNAGAEQWHRWVTARADRAPACLSLAALDQLRLGELAQREADAAQTHLRGCPTCAATQQALLADQHAFVATANLGALAADALARAAHAANQTVDKKVHDAGSGALAPWWQRWVPRIGVMAVAAAGLFLVARPSSQRGDTESPAFRSKGALSLQVYVLHAEATESPGTLAGGSADGQGGFGARGTLHLGEPLHPGDRVRFGVSSGAAGGQAERLVVLGADEAGQISIYHASSWGPGDGARLLPAAIELDDTLGTETFIALRCAGKDAVATNDAAVTAAVRQALEAGKGTAGVPGPLGLPCDETRYAIKKVAR